MGEEVGVGQGFFSKERERENRWAEKSHNYTKTITLLEYISCCLFDTNGRTGRRSFIDHIDLSDQKLSN